MINESVSDYLNGFIILSSNSSYLPFNFSWSLSADFTSGANRVPARFLLFASLLTLNFLRILMFFMPWAGITDYLASSLFKLEGVQSVLLRASASY